MKFFEIVGDEFFKPLTSKNKEIYLDCLYIIYDCCGRKTSNSEERAIIQEQLINYFESVNNRYVLSENDDGEKLVDAREKSNNVLKYLRNCGWVYEDIAKNYITKISLNDYSVSLLDCLRMIQKDEETEYQNVIQTIYSIVINEDAYLSKPYENIVIGVEENVDKLTKELKKLSTSIKKYIDKSVAGKTAQETIEDYFTYHREIGSRAYHRLKTSNNISRYRPTIKQKLRYLINDPDIFNKTVLGYMEIKNIEDKDEAAASVKTLIHITNKF